MGTVAQAIVIPYEQVSGDGGVGVGFVRAAGMMSVQVFVGLDSVNILTACLNIICSTGTAGIRDATYDIAGVYAGFGAALRLDIFDVARFEHLTTKMATDLTDRALTWQETYNLKSWLSDELSFLGLTLQGRRLSSGRFKLTLDRVSDPLIVGQATLTTADLDLEAGIKIKRVSQGIVNQMTARIMWNPATQDWEDAQWEINEKDSQETYGKRPPMEIKARGMVQSIATNKPQVEQLVLGLMSHYSRPYELVTFSISRSGWRYQPGDQISLTHPGVPNDDGTRGWADEPLIVLAASPVYLGKGRKGAVKLTCLHLGDRKLSYYVPSALVDSYDAPSKTLTLIANEFSDAAIVYPLDNTKDCKDVLWFDLAGSDIEVGIEGDWALRDKRTIDAVNVDTGEVALTVALSAGVIAAIAAGDRCVIFYPDYDDCSAFQKLFIHLADTSAKLGAADDSAFRYSG